MTSQVKQRVVIKSQRKVQAQQSQSISERISKFSNDFFGVIAELNKRGKLHGIDHFVNKRYHPLERFLWLMLVIAAFFGVFYIANSQLERFRANPTVISLERGTFMVS